MDSKVIQEAGVEVHASRDLINEILQCRSFAVAGASRDPNKFGYQVFRVLTDAGYKVFPVNPNAETIDGVEVYPLLDCVPEPVDCVVTVTQPDVTFEIVRQAGKGRIPYVWMQPGSESERAIRETFAVGCQLIAGGPCVMVEVDRRRREAVGIA